MLEGCIWCLVFCVCVFVVFFLGLCFACLFVFRALGFAGVYGGFFGFFFFGEGGGGGGACAVWKVPSGVVAGSGSSWALTGLFVLVAVSL